MKLLLFFIIFMPQFVNANLKLKNYPVLIIYIDGPDGAGKTTILNFLNQHYDAITPPKSTEIGLMPINHNENVEWFQTQNPFVTARLYLISHQKRFEYLNNYNSRAHYKLINKSRGFAPTLVLVDRGPLSARAYAFSSIKLSSALPSKFIIQFINQQFRFLVKNDQSINIVLYPDISKAQDLLKRLKNVPNPDRELKLIEGQIEYYQKYAIKHPESNILFLDPFESLNHNIDTVKKFVDKASNIMLKQEKSKIDLNNFKRVYLSEVLENILSTKRKGKVVILGGIVQKGYTDNDVDIVCEDNQDKAILNSSLSRVVKNIHIYPAKADFSLSEDYFLTIDPEN